MASLWRMVVRTKFPGGSTRGTNTWYFSTAAATFPSVVSPITNVQNFYNAIHQMFGATYSWTWDGSVTNVATDTPALQTPLTGWTVTGSAGGNTESGPAGVGLCISWKSVLANKNGRGRTFISPLPMAWFQSDGTLLDANLTTVRSACAAFVTAQSADAQNWNIVYSQMQKQGRIVVASSVADKVAYLSSRRT